MAINNSTATTPKELSEQFPCTARPFAVWYLPPEDGETHGSFAVNDEEGNGSDELKFEDLVTALKMAAAMSAKSGWDAEARIQAQALAEATGAYKSGIIQQHIEEFCITMNAYFDLAMGEIEKHNSDDFDSLRFLTEAAKTKLHEFSGKAYVISEEAEAAHA